MYLKVFTVLTAVCAIAFARTINDENTIKNKSIGYEVVGDNSYLIIDFLKVNRYEAELFCKKIGADLAALVVRYEETLLLNYLSNTGRNPVGKDGGLWISLSNQNYNGIWYWTANGRPLTYQDGWQTGQPDTAEQTCATLRYDGFDNDYCDMLRGFICQK